jgi:UDP-N-acetylglucosamine 2-epimerase (non-hydrolysing)
MGMKNIVLVIGTRPNFVKIARLEKLLRKEYNLYIYHTGQHDSHEMSQWFIDFFKIKVDKTSCLLIGNDPTKRFGQILEQFNEYIFDISADHGNISAVMVVGDVDSTLACALTAKKWGLKIIHLEAGLRSFDKHMPEEVNRVLTDHISDIKLVTDPVGIQNLLDENCAKTGIDTFWVGNTMIDTLRWLDRYHVKDNYNTHYDIIATFHRPENVDYFQRRSALVDFLIRIKHKTVVCAHPRFESNLGEGLLSKLQENNVRILSQPNYLTFIKMIKGCTIVLTDSGGAQEEAAYFHKPTITLRNNTERPLTTYINDNLVTGDLKKAKQHIERILDGTLHDDAYYIRNNPYHSLGDSVYSLYSQDEKKLYWRNNASQDILKVLRKVI